MTSILQLTSSSTPYNKTLKVRVAMISPRGWTTYQSTTGAHMAKLVCMLADSSSSIKCIAYHEKFATALVEGKTLAIRNFIFRDGVLRLSSQAHVLRLPEFPVPQHVLDEARHRFALPLSPVKPISEVKQSPIKSKVSFTGQVITDQAVREVRVPNKSQPVTVRDITVKDSSGQVQVCLWQNSAILPLTSGMSVVVKDATLNYSQHYKDHVAAVNNEEDIEITQPQAAERDLTVTAVDESGDDLIFLVQEEDEHLLYVIADLVYDELLLPAGSIDDLLALLPLPCRATVVNGRITVFRTPVDENSEEEAVPQS